jgi:uncharacterized membrane protein
MKKINLWYWIVTGLFAAFMLMSGIQNAMATPESVKLISTDLGYPLYFSSFIGVAKIIGVIGILLPNLRRLKEWAYAGLFFDLFSATYSMIMVLGFEPYSMIFMVLLMVFLFLSYYLWHKKIGTAQFGSPGV